jgi:regulator of protease activity HflC (stomatin/prohibitin superfamily)
MNTIIFVIVLIVIANAVQKFVKQAQSSGGARVVDASSGASVQINNFLNGMKKRIGAGLVALVVVVVLFNSFVVIDSGELGVQSLFGKVYEKTLSSGLHFVNPLVRVHRFNAKTQNYTMSAVQDEGKLAEDDAIRVLSSDGLEIILDVTVLYRVLPEQTPNILRQVGTNYEDNIVRPIVRTKLRDAAVYYQAIEVFSTKRDELQNRIFSTIEQNFKERGLVLEQLLVRNIELPQSVKTAIEAKINAEQESQKYDFLLQKEKKEADRKRIEAEGQRDSQAIINQSLTDKFLYYQYINQLKDRAGTIYVPTNPSTGLPQFKDLGR